MSKALAVKRGYGGRRSQGALSVGTSFPIIRYFVERVERGRGPPNIHIFVAHNPDLDAHSRSTPSDAPGHVHGFKGGSTLDGLASAAKLWLPQLAAGRRNALGRLFDFVAPHDTCPTFPFPASNPRLGDALAEEYMVELENTWAVDTRNIVYADEGDPLDLYRTFLRLDDLRKPVFAGAGGSLLALSPLGSKVMALGALMAALREERAVMFFRSSLILGWQAFPIARMNGDPASDRVRADLTQWGVDSTSPAAGRPLIRLSSSRRSSTTGT